MAVSPTTPPYSTCFSRVLAFASLSLTTIGPACPTTLRQPNRGEVVFLGVLVFYLGCITATSARLISLRLPNRDDTTPSGVLGAHVSFFSLSPPIPRASFLPGGRTVAIQYLVGLLGVCLPSLYHRRFRSLPSFQAVVVKWSFQFQLRLYFTEAHQRIVAILRLRV